MLPQTYPPETGESGAQVRASSIGFDDRPPAARRTVLECVHGTSPAFGSPPGATDGRGVQHQDARGGDGGAQIKVHRPRRDLLAGRRSGASPGLVVLLSLKT